MQKLEIEYRLTVEDVVALTRYWEEHFPDGRKRPRTRGWAWKALAIFLTVGVLVYGLQRFHDFMEWIPVLGTVKE
jgi:hypothetical protein